MPTAELKFPLDWPKNWPRTRIKDVKPNKTWKKGIREAIEDLQEELGRMKATEAVISYNSDPNAARMDPGVAVFWSMEKATNFDWQESLKLDTPAPTVKQIDDAYRRLVMAVHPDRPGNEGKEALFVALTKHRDNAIAWIRGEHSKQHEYEIAVDTYNEPRLNITAIRMILSHMRALDRLGVPGIAERTFKGFKPALGEGVKRDVEHTATNVG